MTGRLGRADAWRLGILSVASVLIALPVGAASAVLWNPAPQSFDRGGAPGGDVIAPIVLNGADGVNAMDFSFTYDPILLRAKGVHRTGYTDAYDVSYDFTTPGLVELSLDGGPDLAGSGEVAWVVFRVDGAQGAASDLSWNFAVLNGGAIPALLEDGRLPIVSGAAVVSTPDRVAGAPGALVEVPISAVPADGALGIDLRLTFNPGVLQAQSVATTSLTESMSLTFNLTTPGQAVISLFAGEPIAGSGVLVNVTCAVVGPVGDATPLNLARGDLNEREIPTVLDDGLFVVCDAVDRDGDTVSDCEGDCDGLDPLVYPGAPERCNGIDDDCDSAVDDGIVAPDGRPALRVARTGETADLTWTTVVGADAYDAVRGDLGLLRGTAGDFSAATDACLADDRAATWLADPAVPSLGGGVWYLVRPVNCAGAGTYDTASAAQSGSRDVEIAASPSACP